MCLPATVPEATKCATTSSGLLQDAGVASSSTLGHRFCGPSSCHCILSTSWALPSCWLYQVSLWEKCAFRGTTPSLGRRWCSSPSPAAHTGPCSGGNSPVAIPMHMGHDSALMHTKGLHPWSSGSGAAHSLVRRGDKWLWLWQQSQVFSGRPEVPKLLWIWNHITTSHHRGDGDHRVGRWNPSGPLHLGRGCLFPLTRRQMSQGGEPPSFSPPAEDLPLCTAPGPGHTGAQSTLGIPGHRSLFQSCELQGC